VNNNNNNNEAIVLIDPDFIFLRAFELPSTVVVRPGKPAAAKYGLGDQWLELNRTAICQSGSGCATVTSRDIRDHYNVGPPYIIHVQDVIQLSKRWVELVPSIYDQYPLLYAEMFAYQAAAADIQLQHTLVTNLFMGCMINWPNKVSTKLSVETYMQQTNNNNNNIGASSCFVEPLRPPPFLHYCRRYAYHNTNNSDNNKEPLYYFIAKRRVPGDILDCTTENYLTPFPSNENEKNYDEGWSTLTACAILRAVNYAKHSHCNK